MADYEDISIDQGADVAIELHMTNTDGSVKNLANHSVAAKMKRNYNSDSDNAQAFNAAITGATDGIATLSLTNTQTAALATGRWVYDVELSFVDSSSNTITERILEGKVFVTPSVTK
tara:strand:- start:11124 stop:11474 length:351 start_codon:yes stop_codon:yes gene_type:complete